jgi:hypothetical protein
VKKWEMILLSIYKLSEREMSPQKYEDIIVHTYKLFPKEFQLPGYAQYPDTESISKKIYDILRPKGFVSVAKRQFMITKTGLEYAKALEEQGPLSVRSKNQLPASYVSELERIVELPGYILFSGNEAEKLIDQDYYDFYKISVRSNLRDVSGMQKMISDVIEAAKENGSIVVGQIVEYKKVLDNTFKEIFNDENSS